MELIDRAELRFKIADYIATSKYKFNENSAFIVGDIADIINEFKTTDGLFHAKWIKKIESNFYWYACSNCEGDIPYNNYKQWMFSEYCPHCGAKMDDIDNEED